MRTMSSYRTPASFTVPAWTASGRSVSRRRTSTGLPRRRENYGQPMEDIMSALAHIARTHEDVELVYPVHLSPVVQECARKHLGDIPNVHLIAPLAADEMHNLMARCYLVLTDSGRMASAIRRQAPPSP